MEKILLVEDDRFFREVFSALLRDDGYRVDTAESGGEALRKLSKGGYQMVVTDLAMPGIDGLGVLSMAKQLDPSIDVIVVTGHAEVQTAIQALKNGARDYLVKPIDQDEFRHCISLCAEQRRLLNENQDLKRQVSLYQASQAIANCLELDRLGPMVVAAFASEVGVERGFGLFLDDEEYFAVKGIKELDKPAARALAELAIAGFEKRDNKGDSFVILKDFIPADPRFAFAAKAALKEALVLEVRSKSVQQGVVVLFNDKKKPLPNRLNSKNLGFLLDQSSLAVDNAARFATARNLVNIDELTGLFNYRYLETALEREIKRAERYRSCLSVVFLDLDQFKEVNDTHGHLVGSKVLREVGVVIKRLVREVDTVIRYGGDEYTIVLVESAVAGAASVAERIRRAVEEHTFLADEGYNIRITVSLGYACYPDDTKSHIELLQLADQAMYRGKSSGRNVVFHVGSMK